MSGVGRQIPAPSACPECGYSLAGLPPLAREHPCPECGFPASRLAPPEQWLRHADPRWLRRVVWGARLSLLSQRYLICFVLASLAALVVTIVLETLADFSILGPEAGWPFEVGLVITVVVGVALHGASCFLLTSPPGEGGPPDALSRKLSRYCGMAFAPCCLLSSFLQFLLVQHLPVWAVYAAALAMLLTSVCYLAAQPLWLRRLEWRTASWKLDSPRRYRTARRALSWMVGLAVLLELYWSWLPTPGGLSIRDEEKAPQIWWLLMLIAFAVMTDSVTRPAIQALRAELKGLAPAERGSPAVS